MPSDKPLPYGVLLVKSDGTAPIFLYDPRSRGGQGLQPTEHNGRHYDPGAAAEGELKELVMGLRWHPRQPGDPAGAEPANLDALCVVLDQHGRAVDAVHPGRPRNANGSIVHTGDSPTGAGAWDDERIFVFLEALPEAACTVSFAVASANGRAFASFPGASCHVSDRVTEHEWIRLDLASAFGPHRACRVATIRRERDGWRMAPDAQEIDEAALAALLTPPQSPDP